ncbi:MAG: hypothetical protein JXA15_12080 [Spirochaetales bacterium]|nr:hypothetical protein [Spirochaetales bacterium]
MGKYHLADDAKVFWDGDETFRVRKGIWNYTEAVLAIGGEEEKARDFYRRCADALILERCFDPEAIGAAAGLDAEGLAAAADNFSQLARQGFLHTEDQSFLTRSLVNLLSMSFTGIDDVKRVQPALFLSTDPTSAKVAGFLSDEMKYPLDMADEALMAELSAVDLTTRSEAMEHLKAFERLEERLKPYSAILGCFLRPPIGALRNLNRVLVKLRIPLLLGFVDGPFLTLLCTSSPETGCFECFEHRVLARLEDTAAYTSFVRKAVESGRKKEGEGKAHASLIGFLVSSVLAEGFLASSLRINKLAGRIINVYLPTLEIQVQDLLRVPYCPACGSVAAADMDELYTSGRAVIDRMLDKIQIVSPN